MNTEETNNEVKETVEVTTTVEVKDAEIVTEQPKDEVMSTFTNTDGVRISRRDLSEEELRRKKLELESLKISQDKAEIELKELEDKLDAKIPAKFVDDDIAKTKKAIEDKKIKEETLTEADVEDLKIHLVALEKQKELDIPTRELRLRIQSLRESLNSVDGPARRVKLLEKQIRERSENFVAPQQNCPIGVN
jgi:hypothetical protein